MVEIELKELMQQPGQTQESIAEQLGVTQGAVSQMLREKKPVYVVRKSDGTLEAYRKTPVGRRSGKSSQVVAVQHHVRN